MTEIIDLITAIGGTCFYTGVSLRNRLLNLPEKNQEVLVYGITKEELKNVLDNTAYTELVSNDLDITAVASDGGKHHFKIIGGINDLHKLSDFTINSIYVNCKTQLTYDPHGGMIDLRNKILRTSRVAIQASPKKLLEAAKLVSELAFTLSLDTWFEIYAQAQLAKFIEPSQIKDELTEILLLKKPSIAFKLLQETGVLNVVLPELAACENIIQSKRSGIKNVFEHVMYTLDAAEHDITTRLTMLFHDIAKPQTLEMGDDGKIHFFKHESVGAKIARNYLRYWGFEKRIQQVVPHLVLHHMFDADPRLTDKSVRRLIKKVGKDLIYDLLKIRIADRLGTPNKISMKKIKILKKKIDREITNI